MEMVTHRIDLPVIYERNITISRTNDSVFPFGTTAPSTSVFPLYLSEEIFT